MGRLRWVLGLSTTRQVRGWPISMSLAGQEEGLAGPPLREGLDLSGELELTGPEGRALLMQNWEWGRHPPALPPQMWSGRFSQPPGLNQREPRGEQISEL